MKKSFLLIGAISVLVALIAISLSGDATGLNLIVGTEPVHNIARSLLIVALLALAFTVRPRARVVRYGLALVSVAITALSVYFAAGYALQIIDALVYVVCATVLMTEALEDGARGAPATRLRKIRTVEA